VKWSYSKAKTFNHCQRKWYYAEIMAQWNAKEPLRKEVYLLKQLRSIHAWRGNIVDTVIHKMIIPRMVKGKLPSEQETIRYATALAERQLDFGKRNRHREPGMTQTKGGDNYCAFFDVEYKNGLNEMQVEKAKQEINAALSTLLCSPLLVEIKRNASKIIPQRNLIIPANDFNVTSRPDLIVFYDNRPPLIVDWKVHEGRNTDYWLQLGIYAYVLAQTKPHVDFPVAFIEAKYSAHDYAVTEFQLLKGLTKEYRLSVEDILDIEDYIHSTGSIMKSFVEEDDKFDVRHYASTRYPGMCASCEFGKVCWEAETNVEH